MITQTMRDLRHRLAILEDIKNPSFDDMLDIRANRKR